MNELNKEQLNKVQIEQHLKSAVSSITPNVLDRIDLNTPQDITEISKIHIINRRLRILAGAMAACFCLLVMSGGGYYVYQNGKTDSVIGIDVNPSIELSVNRKNKVLEVEALNNDAVEIIDNMNLKGVDLDIAVNAVIGSMVKHGYLDDMDNAILVTVSNDSISKADKLRQLVVGDIQTTLQENQVEAVVYDQQAVKEDEIQKLADEYNISYGKAYFLKELIDQNPTLMMVGMKELAPLTMEEIAQKITEGSYALADSAKVADKPAKAESTQAPSTAVETTPEETTTLAETTAIAAATTAPPATTQAPTTTPAATTQAPETSSVPETTQEVVADKNNIKIDNVDYEDGTVTVSFSTKVKWSNPTVSVKDEDGTAYSAMIGETDNDFCQIFVDGLEGGRTYTFVLGGIRRGSTGKSTTIKGTFETPVISDDATEADKETTDDDQKEDTELGDDTGAVETLPVETTAKETTKAAETTVHPTESIKPVGTVKAKESKASALNS